MNEETTVPSTAPVTEATEPLTTEVPETAPETTDGTVTTEPVTVPPVEYTEPFAMPGSDPTQATTEETIYEDFSGAPDYESYTEATEPVVIVDLIETVGSDIVHANLFGSFLICGTLVGIALWRNIRGT